MIRGSFIFLFTLLSCSQVSDGHFSRLYIWNVGQGQWATLNLEKICIHFDMGGEKAPKEKINSLCKTKQNQLYLSHADTDHISFIYWSKRNLNKLCLQSLPRETLSLKKAKLISSLSRCQIGLKLIQELTLPKMLLKPNDMSRVFLLKSKRGDILIPGDSTALAEKYWANPKALHKVRVLLIGHHGSKTSTSSELLKSLPSLLISINSARKKRYGHPHQSVVDRLQIKLTPLLKTESWGHLSIEI